MKTGRILAKFLLLVVIGLSGAIASYHWSSREGFLSSEVKGEQNWLKAFRYSKEASELQGILEAKSSNKTAFDLFERAALQAQIELLTTGSLRHGTAEEFCAALAWRSCNKEAVRVALARLFGERR